ncbi:hypothetical protein [Rhizobium laguerreae]|uniref:hypothetical protein n=1 Tax=Rhizobium laguerreae TaxID=1076926 RepID=UPI001C91C46D|nr:hypothetical protein [Rhizobium laguerreae]MBY3488977.1 hypothetical protein [Rhizobium laguerreae]
MTSPDIEKGGKFSNDHIKDGGNLPPQLDWTDPPDGTQSFALMIEDLDALSAPAFRHWGGSTFRRIVATWHAADL